MHLCVTRSNIPRIYVYMCVTRSNNPRILYNVYCICVSVCNYSILYSMSNIPRIYHILYVYLFVPGSTIPRSLCSDLSTHYRMIEDTPVQCATRPTIPRSLCILYTVYCRLLQASAAHLVRLLLNFLFGRYFPLITSFPLPFFLPNDSDLSRS